MRLRRRLDGDHLYIEAVLRMTESAWDQVPWDAAGLDAIAAQLEAALAQIFVSPSSLVGLAHDPHFEWHYETDQLAMGTLYELGGLIQRRHLDEEVAERLREMITSHGGDQVRMVTPATRLLHLYEGE